MDWWELGVALDFNPDLLKTIEGNNWNRAHRTEQCCNDLLSRWLDGEACQSVTWERLIEALKKIECAVLADQLEQTLVLQQ